MRGVVADRQPASEAMVLADAGEGTHPEYLVNPEVLQYTDSQLNPEYHERDDG